MNQLVLPPWVKPEAIAHHKPSYTLFPIYHRRKSRSTGQILLLDAPQGQPAAEYPLDECEQASPLHFSGVALMTIGGKPVTIARQGSIFTVTNGIREVRIRIPQAVADEADVRAVAQDFAAFFDGEVIEREVS